MQHFEKVETIQKKTGKTVKRLKAVSTKSNLTMIIEFINKYMTKTVHHRNQLRHYRNVVKSFKDSFDTIFIDIDFSENLKVPVKYEPQSLHWSHEQITVHSGLLKYQGVKSYHPYLSSDRKHDQHFVHCVLEEMLHNTEQHISSNSVIMIESDNCSCQYKSSAHFDSLQRLSDDIGRKIIRVFGIPEHGKGEVDHVGGIAKTAIRREIAAGSFYSDVNDMVAMLREKFESKESPKYVCKVISENTVLEQRELSKLKVFPTINGSKKFQVMVFKPNQNSFLAAPRICICEQCQNEYGSCALFKTYFIPTIQLKETALRSGTNNGEDQEEDQTTTHEFLLPNTFCAIAADKKSSDTVWFIFIQSEGFAEKDESDSYGFTIKKGQYRLKGHYLEKHIENKKEIRYRLMKKKTAFFFPESVVYPFVQLEVRKDLYYLSTQAFYDILSYVEHYGMTSI